jgi:HK97 family phage prohead protease
MDRKFFRGRTDFKQNGQPGEFKAIFATLNVKDADGDVTLPGAFEEGQPVRISAWGHKWDQLPVGRGTVHSDGKEAWVDGQFLLETETGKEHYNTVKGMGDLQEWSYGFQVEDSIPGQFDGQDVRFLRKMKVIEVAPVMQGAGVDTRTADIKTASGRADLPLADRARPWDNTAAENRVRAWAGGTDNMDWAKYRQAFFWYDPASADQLGGYKLGFADVIDGTLTAIPRGIFAVAGVLSGARGGAQIGGDAPGVRAKVAAYYGRMRREFDDDSIVPPWEKSADPANQKAGARHSSKDNEMLQQMHDLAVELGAKCAGHDDSASDGDDGATDKGRKTTSKEPQSSTLAARVALELLEDEQRDYSLKETM